MRLVRREERTSRVRRSKRPSPRPLALSWPRTFVTTQDSSWTITHWQSAVNQAKAAAAGKSVGVHGADTIQQLLNAGLLDEISIDIAAVLLGSGVRLFDHL